MSDRGYAIKDKNAVHFITFAVILWINACLPGRAGFTRKEYADIVIESLKFCHRNKGLMRGAL